MTFLTRKHLDRRTFLRGAGVTLALPLLDSMVAAQTPLAKTAAAAKTRLGCIYVPHGATMYKWTPASEGKGFEFPEILQPLEKFRERVNVISNLAHPQASGINSDAGADHARSAAVFLSGAHPEKDQVHNGVTLDQIAAEHIGQDTPLPSLELAIEDNGLNCGSGYGCAYTNTISWRSATLPLPMENNPQVVFEKLFGDGSSDEQRRERKQEARSLLDSVMHEVSSLNKELPQSDRAKLSDYLDDIREIERRIQRAENQVPAGLKIPDAPVGVPENIEEHFKIMFDLQVLAYKAEITRVTTMMYARDTSLTVYPQSGNRDAFHVSSHHSNVRANMDKYALINRYHVQLLAYFLDKLKATPDGDGNLLDHSLILYGSSMSNGNQHDHDPLPVLVAGGACGRLDGGRHIVCAPHTHMSNLLVALLDKVGVDQEHLGDSTAELAI